MKKIKQTMDERHPMDEYIRIQRKLKSRSSFIKNSNVTRDLPD